MNVKSVNGSTSVSRSVDITSDALSPPLLDHLKVIPVSKKPYSVLKEAESKVDLFESSSRLRTAKMATSTLLLTVDLGKVVS